MTVHSGLPQEGPGNRASTARALAAAGELPAAPRVLDLGCGPGRQTLDLATLLPAADITGIDLQQRFVDEANARFRAAGVSDRVRARQGDMAAPAEAAGSIDLVWSEGAAYVIGVARALEVWRGLLAPDGRLAFTDAVWLKPGGPAELATWWGKGYPDMTDRAGQIERVEACGYRVRDTFVLPESAWWDGYYLPMEQRIATLEDEWQADATGLAVLAACRREIDYYRRFSAWYGYLFVIAEV